MTGLHFADGIAAQPDALARSRSAVAAAVGSLPAPGPGEVIALVGIGASEHAARTAAHQWRGAGLRAFAVSAADVPGAADRLVLISESGRSTETVQAARAAEGRPTLAVVNDPASPVARACDAVLDLASGPDSPVYTTGYTATLQALDLLGAQWSGRAPGPALADLARRVLEEATPAVEALAETFDVARVVDVVGSAAAAATVGEGALLLRESARLLTAGHETRNYLHGPMEPLDGQTCCLVVGDGRELRLAGDTAALGCPTLLLTTDGSVGSRDRLAVLHLPRAGAPLAQALLDILPIQLLAWAVARRRGLPVDGFRHRQDDTKAGAA